MTQLTTLIFRFSLGGECSYDYDSDSVTSENQPKFRDHLVWQKPFLPMALVIYNVNEKKGRQKIQPKKK